MSIAVVVSANAEWDAVTSTHDEHCSSSPFGQWFHIDVATPTGVETVTFVHRGWGKTAAAAPTQYAIDLWAPELIVNLGTAGGLRGRIQPGAIILTTSTVVYDIYERTGDAAEAVDFYCTRIDTSWVQPHDAHAVTPAQLASADRDLDERDIETLIRDHGAIAGDWESGAIAWVTARNEVPCLILRGITDLVDTRSGDAYNDDGALFVENTEHVMTQLTATLSHYIACWRSRNQAAPIRTRPPTDSGSRPRRIPMIEHLFECRRGRV